jgi:hypothetical protein
MVFGCLICRDCFIILGLYIGVFFVDVVCKVNCSAFLLQFASGFLVLFSFLTAFLLWLRLRTLSKAHYRPTASTTTTSIMNLGKFRALAKI